MITFPFTLMISKFVPDPVVSGYGKLYNWYAVDNANFCPSGWHVPTITEYSSLVTFLGTTNAGGYMKEVGTTYWNSPNTGADNASGFTAYGGGYHSSYTDYSYKEIGSFWTSTEYDSTHATGFLLMYNDAGTSQGNHYKYTARSVRLIKDDSSDPGSLTDYDGNVYTTLPINGQVWLMENWKCEHMNDGTYIKHVTGGLSSSETNPAWVYYGDDPNYN